MKARPILFSGPMVRALLEGRKTQTRRVVKDHDIASLATAQEWNSGRAHPRMRRWEEWGPATGAVLVRLVNGTVCGLPCPYGAPGDLLWVREQGRLFDPNPTGNGLTCYQYAVCDGEEWWRVYPPMSVTGKLVPPVTPAGRWRPSIHMPRWASRLTLRVTDVRVERVQDISEEDAKAEGVDVRHDLPWPDGDPGFIDNAASRAFANLWNSINGADAWARNDWCWCLTFEVLQQNVDAVLDNAA